jgi:hypothetical protein
MTQHTNPTRKVTTMPPADPDDQQQTIYDARNAARRAALALAVDSGAQVIQRPLHPGTQSAVRDVEPLAGLAAACQIEFGARHAARAYIRQAREAGHGWDTIGTALSQVLGAGGQQAGESTGEAAFSYAAGSPDTDSARRYGRSFTWTCRTCDGLILDQGLCNGPSDDERGHAARCTRLAATIAASDAEAAIREAEREAGQ